MNYQKIYDDICKRGQERQLPKEVYTEKHHIVPRCIGGGNEKSNLTVLTAREHFLVHLILARKLYPKNPKIWYAFHRMLSKSKTLIGRYIPSGKIYEKLREETNGNMKGRTFNQVTLILMSERQKGKQVNLKRLIHIESGMVFDSCLAACDYFQVTQGVITNWIKHKIFKVISKTEYLVLKETNKNNFAKIPTRRIRFAPVTVEFKQKCRENSTSTKICEVDGVIYKSVRIASEHLNIPYYTVHHRIQSTSKKWSNWSYP